MKESLQLKFAAACRLFMVTTVSMSALYVTGPNNVRMANWEELIYVINNVMDDL
jgi:hypothetical protein